MKVLVTGAGGQLGHDVVAVCASAGDDVVAVESRRARRHRRGPTWPRRSPTIDPDVVIHCAAWTAVDDCESDPDRAFAVNADRGALGREASELAGAHLCTISTDYVFDGTLDRPYHERDAPNPLSVYGRVEARRRARGRPRDATVVRTSWVCGEHGSNMVRTVLRLAAERDTLSFVDDQRGCPTFTADLAPMLRRLAVERRSRHPSRHQPGRGQLVRVRAQHRGGAAGRTRRWSARSAPPTSIRHARPHDRPTACSTTPSCATPGCRCCATTASRSPSWSPG